MKQIIITIDDNAAALDLLVDIVKNYKFDADTMDVELLTLADTTALLRAAIIKMEKEGKTDAE